MGREGARASAPPAGPAQANASGTSLSQGVTTCASWDEAELQAEWESSGTGSRVCVRARRVEGKRNQLRRLGASSSVAAIGRAVVVVVAAVGRGRSGWAWWVGVKSGVGFVMDLSSPA